MNLRNFIHQASVRRHVVIQLIAEGKRRGHRAYRHVDMGKVRTQAKELPVKGVPRCIVKLLPYERSLDKIIVQKAACPVPGGSTIDVDEMIPTVL